MYNALINCSKNLQRVFSPWQRGALYYLSIGAAMGSFMPFLNVYFRQELGFTGQQIGILSMFFPLMTVVVAMPLSALADRYSWHVAILAGAISGYGLLVLFAQFPHHFLIWVGFMICLAIFNGPIGPLGDSLVARMALSHNLNYGSMRLWASLSFSFAAVGGGALWEQFGFGAMFLVGGGIFFIPVFLFAAHLEESPIPVEQRKKAPVTDILRDAGFVVLIGTSFLIGAALRVSFTFDGIYMRHLGGTQFLVGLMFGLSAFSELPTMQYSARIVRHLSGPKTLLLAYATLIVAFLGYTLAWQPWMLLLTAMAKGLGFGLFYVSTVQAISKRAPESHAATVQSIFMASFSGIAPLLATPLGGRLYDDFGVKAVYLCASIVVGGATLILLTAISRGVFRHSL